MKFSEIQQFIKEGSYEVNIPLDGLKCSLEHYFESGLNLEPKFQRAHVWTDTQRTKYIEWVLRGGRSGREILWNCAGWMKNFKGPVYLVDGLQRITAVRKFFNNEIPAFGTLYKDFSGHLDIISCNFIFYVNDLDKYEDVLKWYLDINDGGTVHSEMELNRVRLLLEKEKFNV